MGFSLSGELLGMEGIAHGKHGCDAIALEDSQICAIPYAALQRLGSEIPSLGHGLNCMMSREIGRGYGVMLLLGSMSAEQRLATFLLNISQRLRARGYSPSEFVLRMTRFEIGSYLGMKLETVSRMFSQFQSRGIVAACGKEIHIAAPEKLKAIVQGADPHLGEHLKSKNAVVTFHELSPVQAANATR